MQIRRPTQQAKQTRRDDKKLDDRSASLKPQRPVPLDPSQLDQIGGGNGTQLPRTTW